MLLFVIYFHIVALLKRPVPNRQRYRLSATILGEHHRFKSFSLLKEEHYSHGRF